MKSYTLRPDTFTLNFNLLFQVRHYETSFSRLDRQSGRHGGEEFGGVAKKCGDRCQLQHVQRDGARAGGRPVQRESRQQREQQSRYGLCAAGLSVPVLHEAVYAGLRAGVARESLP